MTFEFRRTYTRDEIHEALGGSKQSYLPTVDGVVTCGAFTTDLNPDAPQVVLAGRGPIIERSAELFARQSSSVPVFIKHGVNDWRYVGEYHVKELSRNPAVIAERAQAAGRTNDVSLVLFLERTDRA